MSTTPGAQGASRDASTVSRELHEAHPEFDEVPLLEDDETIPPRPEEEIADAGRAEPAG